MRELKFRAWDVKQMREVYDMTFTRTGVSCRAKYGNPRTLINVPLMQFTGLLDKNGTDIYEGDIVQGFHAATGKKLEDHINKVEWRGASWGYSNCMFPQNCEVIGNIYQNPELLK